MRVAAEVCEGLACAHEEGVVHCDLKPANILFDSGWIGQGSRLWHRPRFRRDADPLVDDAGRLCGRTLPYMSPEQADGVRDDPRIDVYALGAVLYRVLTGQTYLAFDPRETPRSQADNVGRIYHEQPSPPSSLHKRRDSSLAGRGGAQGPGETT